MHAGLVVEAAGLLGIYAVLHGAAGGVSTVDLLAPMVVGGAGMGMVDGCTTCTILFRIA